MAHAPPYPDSTSDTGDDTGARPSRGSTDESTPRWVKVFGLLALVLALLFVILMLTGGGNHGPGRHMRAGDGGGDTRPPASRTTPPPQGGH